MKQAHLFPGRTAMLLVMVSLMVLVTGFHQGARHPKPFMVASLKQGGMDQSVLRKLTEAYKAQYGQKAKIEAITIVTEGDQSWLWFVGAEKGSPTFALELKVADGHFTLQFGEPLGINNCITAGDCARCKVGCDCARDQGNDKCTTKTTTSVLGAQMAAFVERLQ